VQNIAPVELVRENRVAERKAESAGKTSGAKGVMRGKPGRQNRVEGIDKLGQVAVCRRAFEGAFDAKNIEQVVTGKARRQLLVELRHLLLQGLERPCPRARPISYASGILVVRAVTDR